jgi:hypothetical protein
MRHRDGSRRSGPRGCASVARKQLPRVKARRRPAIRSARREMMRGLVWLMQSVRAPPPGRARRCSPSGARRWRDGASCVDGEGQCACSIGVVRAMWAAGLCGPCGGSAASGLVRRRRAMRSARRERGGLLPVRLDSRVFALEAREDLALCCVRNVSVGFDVLGLLGAMFICRRGPHKIRLLLVHWHSSGALQGFGHAFLSFRTRTCSFGCCMRMHVVC